MAKNTGNDHRKGSVKNRSQFERPSGHSQKRMEGGLFGAMKKSLGAFKGVAKEPDGRKGK